MERLKKVLFLLGIVVGTVVICLYTRLRLTFSSNRPTPLSVSYALKSNTVTKVTANGSNNREIKHGYIVSLKYSGQQGAAVRALASQLCWVGSFSLPMYIVEPFIVNSVMGVPAQEINTVPRLSDYFDTAYFNSRSAKAGFALLTTWEDFLDNAPRNAILVQLSMSPRGKPLIKTSVVWEATTTVPCFTSNTSMSLRFLIRYANICITKVVKIPCMSASGKTFTAEEMNNVMFGKRSPNEVTLIFMLWRTPWIIPNSRSNGQNSVCGFNAVVGDKLRPSLKLLRNAEDYKRLYLNAKTFLAVMLRTEHSINALSRSSAYRTTSSADKLAIDSCLQEVLNLAQKLQKIGGVFTTADVGRFASGTWKQTFSKFKFSSQQKAHTFQAVKDTVVALYKNKLTFEEWEESFSKATGGIQDGGYIAALQRTIASQADCLILMGGGNFQRLALQEYLHNHPDKSKQCFHMVCEENLSVSDTGVIV